MGVINPIIKELNSQWAIRISVLLMIQYYILWILSYINILTSSIYYSVMYVSSILYLSGLLIILLRALIKIITMTKNDHFLLTTMIITAIFIVLSATLSYIKHLTYNSTAWDLGIFMQALYTTAYYHKPLYYTVELYINPSGSFLGTHFSPILFTLVPIYYLSPHALTLLAIQAVLVYGATIPLYFITINLTKDRFVSFMVALIYLLAPGLSGLIYFDFHVEAFIPLIYFLLIYYFIQKRYTQSLIFLALFLMIIEFTQIIALALLIPIIYSIIKNKEITIKYKVSYTILYILVILIFLTITPKITGIFNPAKSSVTYIPSAIAGYKGPIMGLLGYIRKHVYAVINFLAVNYKIKVSYFMVNLLPLFASVLEPIWSLPALPYIIFSSLSNYSAYYEIPYQYATYFVPQIFIAYIMGITKIKHKKTYCSGIIHNKHIVFCIIQFIKSIRKFKSMDLYL